MGNRKGGFYAVARGRVVGIFDSWDECKAQVDGFENGRFKKFSSKEEAEAFIEEHRDRPTPTTANASNVSGPALPLLLRPTFAVTVPPPRAPLEAVPPLPSAAATSTSTKNQASSVLATARRVLGPERLTAPKSPQERKRKALKRLKVKKDMVTRRGKFDIANSEADLRSFTVDNDGYVVVFTDGACVANGKWNAKAGIGVYFGKGHPLNISEPVRGRQTNNTAEIQAVERAIMVAKSKGINKLNVRTDSQFTINCMTKWIYHWRENNWKTDDGAEVKNRADLIKLDSAMEGMEIKWSFVRGHRGIRGNEAADRLARTGVRKGLRQRDQGIF